MRDAQSNVIPLHPQTGEERINGWIISRQEGEWHVQRGACLTVFDCYLEALRFARTTVPYNLQSAPPATVIPFPLAS